LVSGGTDNHLVLIDLTKKGITGLEAERLLGNAGIVSNKNSIPFEKRGPKVTSGLRLGTPALTTRGMKEREMKQVSRLIRDLLENSGDSQILEKVQEIVSDLCNSFPIYD